MTQGFPYEGLEDDEPGFDCPASLRSALTNLERCPAWQQSGPVVRLHLSTEDSDEMPCDGEDFSAMVRVLPHLVSKQLHLIIEAHYLVMDTQAVQELGDTMCTRVVHLELQRCQTAQGFWPAVWAHLPGLQTLTLHDTLSVPVCLEMLASFCSQATHPLQLKLGKDTYSKLAAGTATLSETPEEQFRAWSGPQVTVEKMLDEDIQGWSFSYRGTRLLN
jgi:hypothetical protein